MCKLKLEVFVIQDKSRLDLSVFVCLQKKIVGKLTTLIRKRKAKVSPLIGQESTVTQNRLKKHNNNSALLSVQILGTYASVSKLQPHI